MQATAVACERYTEDAAGNAQLVVGSVQIRINDVFDNTVAQENQPVHRWTNQLHVESKRELIEAQLLFASGESFDASLLAETARKLRGNDYLRSATVTAMQICEGEVDILVETGDNWSLIPIFNFSRAGGQNQIALSLSELNLFGLGKSLELGVDYGPVRDQQILSYRDPMLFGSDIQFTTQLQNNTDGEVQVLKFARPFNSLDATSSWAVRVGNTEYIQSLYDDGQRQSLVSVDREFGTFQKGLSQGRKVAYQNQDGKTIYRVLRFRAGWRYDRLRLKTISPTPQTPTTTDRLFSYPFVELDLLQPEFIEQSNLQLMESIEDINVGHRLRTRIGVAVESFGSSTDALIIETDYTKGWKNGNRTLSLLDTSINGYVSADGIDNGVAKATLNSFYFATQKSSVFSSLSLTTSTKLFEDRQVVLGGATGLRGYPLNFQTGEHSARMTLEHRYFFDWYPFRAARIGTATFADIGSVWSNEEDPLWLRDVGIGLRVVGTRHANAKVLHVDFAFPLDERDRIDGFQFVVSTKAQF